MRATEVCDALRLEAVPTPDRFPGCVVVLLASRNPRGAAELMLFDTSPWACRRDGVGSAAVPLAEPGALHYFTPS